MPQNELKDRILGWCSQASEIAAVQDRDEGGADFALLLRLNRPEGMRLGVFRPAGSDRVAVIHTLMFPAGAVRLGDTSQPADAASSLGEAVERIVEARTGALGGTTRQTSDGQEVTLTFAIYSDGLSKHTFLTSIQELGRVRRSLDRLHAGDLEEVNPAFPASPTSQVAAAAAERPAVTGVVAPAAPEPTAEGEEAAVPVAAPVPVPAPVPAPMATPQWSQQPSAQPAAQPQPEPEPQPVAQQPVAPAPQAPPWAPSHRVPPAGMDAWAVPDPTQRAIARIDAGVPVQVTETAGAWAHVLCSNGWSGWVDYRILVPAGP